MSPSEDFLVQATKHLRECFEGLRPKLLEAQGNIEHRLKDDNSVVTEMDTFAEDEIAKALSALDSSIPFGGEESGVDYSKPTFWLTDPIDGTEPFIRGMPFATNMVSLIDNGEAVLGVIYNFGLGDFYVAIKGKGATCNGHPIHVSNRPLNRGWVGVSVSMDKPGTAGVMDKIAKKVNSVRRYGASGYEYTLIANGGLDGRVTFNGNGHEWDFAPGMLLVKEAGGEVANIGSDSYNYRDFNHVAANPVIFSDLMELMKQVKNDAKSTS